MKKLITLLLITVFLFGCKKETEGDAPKSDKANRIFRIIISGNSAFSLDVFENANGGPSGFGVINRSADTAGFNQGFTPASGSIVKVFIESSSAGNLVATIYYKGSKIERDTISNQGGVAVYKAFSYEVKD